MTLPQYYEQEIKSVLKPPLIISNFVATAFHKFLVLLFSGNLPILQ